MMSKQELKGIVEDYSKLKAPIALTYWQNQLDNYKETTSNEEIQDFDEFKTKDLAISEIRKLLKPCMLMDIQIVL